MYTKSISEKIVDVIVDYKYNIYKNCSLKATRFNTDKEWIEIGLGCNRFSIGIVLLFVKYSLKLRLLLFCVDKRQWSQKCSIYRQYETFF